MVLLVVVIDPFVIVPATAGGVVTIVGSNTLLVLVTLGLAVEEGSMVVDGDRMRTKVSNKRRWRSRSC